MAGNFHRRDRHSGGGDPALILSYDEVVDLVEFAKQLTPRRGGRILAPMNQTAALPTAAQFSKTLETTGQALSALVGIRSRTVKIPANVKKAMRGFANVVAWAKKQPEVYAAALATQTAATPAPAGKKTRKAGA